MLKTKPKKKVRVSKTKQHLLGPPKGYIDYVDAGTLKKLEEDSSTTYNPLRPSSAGKCERELGYDYLQYLGLAKYKVEPMSPTQKRIFELGYSVEYHVLKQFSHMVEFRTTYKQQSLLISKLKNNEWIKGSSDFCFWSDKHKCVGDIKSKKDKFSNYYSSEWKETNELFKEMNTIQELYKGADRVFQILDLSAFIDELYIKAPKIAPWLERNFLQLNLYAVNDFFVKQGIDHAVLVQYNKNLSELREIRFAPSNEAAKVTTETFHRVHDMVTKNKSVKNLNRDFTLGSGPCGFCDHKERCRPNSDTLKAYFDKNFDKKYWPKDTDRLDEDGERLEQLYTTYKAGTMAEQEKKRAEEQMLEILEKKKIWKVRFSDQYVYRRKTYKSPYPHFKLKRDKI